MTSFDIQQKFIKIIQKFNADETNLSADMQNLRETYVELFGRWPLHYYISDDINVDKTTENFKEKFDVFIMDHTTNYDIKSNKIETIYGSYIIFDGTIVLLTTNISEIFTDLPIEQLIPLYEQNKEESPSSVYWVTRGQLGFNSTKLSLKPAKFNIKTHYNDDFDYNKVNNFINDESSGLVILHGTYGTAKSYLLRHLAQENPDKEFYFFDRSTFEYIGDSDFVDFLQDIENSVIILEDCESLLQDRNQGNAFLSTILNLADGLLGDGLKLKFLCTFNANINSIDKAVLRKGRLKYQYEFKALTPEKTQELAKELNKNIPIGKSLTVGEIYNYNEENNAPVQGKRIGF